MAKGISGEEAGEKAESFVRREYGELIGLRSRAEKRGKTWVVIVVLSILVGIILMGIMFIFIYHQKTYQVYRLQNNFINIF